MLFRGDAPNLLWMRIVVCGDDFIIEVNTSNDKTLMQLFNVFLPAFRLKTLPLACSAILVGTSLAVAEDPIHWHSLIFLLTLLTAFSLQILSNIANDFGDGLKGTDALQLKAQPDGLTGRVMGTDVSKSRTMRNLLIGWSTLTVSLGFLLLMMATETIVDFWVFFGLGSLSVVAAITYTVGKYAYGYYGLGDAAVFLFFGLVGVLGCYYLQTHQFDVIMLFPAMSVGALCTAVLNINNLRDMDTDQVSGKHTFALCVGKQNAKHYHVVLVVCAFIGFAVVASRWAWLYLLTLPFFAWQAQRIYRAKTSAQFGVELPKCVKLILACCFLFSLGLIL